MSEFGLPASRDQLITSWRFSREDGEQRVIDEIATIRRCNALVCASDLLAIGAMAGLRKLGLHLPDDIAVVGWDNIVDGRYTRPTLTTVAPDLTTLADQAMAALVSRIEGDRSTGAYYRVPHELIIRESSGSSKPGH